MSPGWRDLGLRHAVVLEYALDLLHGECRVSDDLGADVASIQKRGIASPRARVDKVHDSPVGVLERLHGKAHDLVVERINTPYDV